MYNQITIIGNLTREIEIKYSQAGSAIANTGIASSHKYKAKSGEVVEDVMFMDLTFFGRSAEIANQYLCKGSKVFVTGRVKLDQWQDKATGAKRSKHGVIVETMKMLDPKPETQGGYQAQQAQPQQQAYQAQAPTYTPQATPTIPKVDMDEEIPF